MNIPLNIDWQQILLHLFNFVILSGGLYFLLYRPVKDFMKKREDYYKDMMQDAESAKEEAGKLKEEYREKLMQMDVEFDKKRAETEKDLERMREEQLLSLIHISEPTRRS